MAKKLKLSNERPGLIDFFFPARCIICREVQNPGVFICPQCARELSVTGSQVSQHGDFFDICYSPFFYEEPLRESFLRYKFRNRPQFSRQFGKWMADCLMAQDKTDFDLITWCPLHWLRKLDRGYDQSYLLAREIGQYITAPVVPTLKKAIARLCLPWKAPRPSGQPICWGPIPSPGTLPASASCWWTTSSPPAPP